MTAPPPDWLAEAAAMPVAFAQVREDPLIDLAVLGRLDRPDLSGMMIASGGCTAAALVASGRLAELHLVDLNPAQLALTRLKLHLLETATPESRRQLLGHAPHAARGKALGSVLASLGLDADIFGPPELLSKLGPDHAGRYELLFAALRAEMGDQAERWPTVLTSPGAAAAAAPDTPLGQAMDRAFDRVMALENLVALFGEAATQNAAEPFARHFARRTRHALAALPTAENPFLWQLLVGQFPAGQAYPWLTLTRPVRSPRLTWTHAPLVSALSVFRDRFDFVHLSNVLDWLTPSEAGEALHRTHQALRPGGLAIIRQLNSTLDLPSLAPAFPWLTDVADHFHANDRSFFYCRIHLVRK